MAMARPLTALVPPAPVAGDIVTMHCELYEATKVHPAAISAAAASALNQRPAARAGEADGAAPVIVIVIAVAFDPICIAAAVTVTLLLAGRGFRVAITRGIERHPPGWQ